MVATSPEYGGKASKLSYAFDRALKALDARREEQQNGKDTIDTRKLRDGSVPQISVNIAVGEGMIVPMRHDG